MLDIWQDLNAWNRQGFRIAIATVITTWGSSPRVVGSSMGVNHTGVMTGSISGGCVEGAVVEECVKAIQSGSPKLLHYGVGDDLAWEFGLGCGGNIEIFVRLLAGEIALALQKAVEEKLALALVTVIKGQDALLGKELAVFQDGEVIGSAANEVDRALIVTAKELLISGQPSRVEVKPGLEVFVNIILPAPTLVIVGGVHIAVALVKIAKAIGYRTVIVDPRRQFGSQARFPEVDLLLHDWPDDAFDKIELNRSTAVAMLTHDPKIDDPGLLKALPSSAFYIGALGSSKTQTSRRERLLAAGLDEKYLAKLYGPIGLDLGGRSPEEIALSIMAEVVLARYRPK